MMFGLGLLSIAFGALSWKYVEAPFRNRSLVSRKIILKFSVTGLFVFASLGIYGHRSKGDLERWDDSIVRHEILRSSASEFVWERKDLVRMSPFDEDKRKVLVIGDSNSGDLINALYLSEISDSMTISSLMRNSGCGNLFLESDTYAHFVEEQRRSICRAADNLLSEEAKTLIEDADLVIFASSWNDWELNLIEQSYKNLVENFGEKFWFWGNKLIVFPSVKELYTSGKLSLQESYPIDPHSQKINENMAAILGEKFIDPYRFFCSENQCRNMDDNGQILLYDGFHFTKAGAILFGEKLIRSHGSLFN